MGPTRTTCMVPAQAPNGEEYETTALVNAATNGQLEAMALLLDRGASLNKPNSNGNNPLMMAADSGHTAMVRLLAERGADLNAPSPQSGVTAFHLACFRNWPGCVEALVRASCDTAAKDKDGLTGKDLAEEMGSTDVLECLARMAKKAAAKKKKRERKRRQATQPVGRSGAAEPDAEETELEAEDLLLAPAELLARATGADRSSQTGADRRVFWAFWGIF